MGYRAKIQPEADEAVSLFSFREKEYNIEKKKEKILFEYI
jgi:hypothetical protein